MREEKATLKCKIILRMIKLIKQRKIHNLVNWNAWALGDDHAAFAERLAALTLRWSELTSIHIFSNNNKYSHAWALPLLIVDSITISKRLFTTNFITTSCHKCDVIEYKW